MSKLILIILILVSSCGKKAQVESGGIIAPKIYPVSDLEKYVDIFELKMALAGNTSSLDGLEVAFDTEGVFSANILGSCRKAYNEFGTEIISRRILITSSWGLLPIASREQLMFHELGHCVLLRGHTGLTADGTGTSIMNAYHLRPDFYTQNYSTLLTELFGVEQVVFTGFSFDDAIYASTVIGEGQLQFKQNVEVEGHEELDTCYSH